MYEQRDSAPVIESKVTQYQNLRKKFWELEVALNDRNLPDDKREEGDLVRSELLASILDKEASAKVEGWWPRIKGYSPPYTDTPVTVPMLPTPTEPLTVNTVHSNNYLNRLGSRTPTQSAYSSTTKRSPYEGISTRSNNSYSRPASSVSPTRPTSTYGSPSASSLSPIGESFAKADLSGIREPTMAPGIKRDIVQILWLSLASALQIAGGVLLQRLMMGHSPYDRPGAGGRPLDPVSYLEEVSGE